MITPTFTLWSIESYSTGQALPPPRLCRNGEDAVIPAKAGIQAFEIVDVSN
jgi:hypothetical protein